MRMVFKVLKDKRNDHDYTDYIGNISESTQLGLKHLSAELDSAVISSRVSQA